MNKQVAISLFPLIFILIIILFYSSIVSGAGIAGATYEKIFFQPGLEKTYTYFVNSNTDKIMDHAVSVSGELAQYFTLSTNVLKDMKPNEERTFTATMKLPQEMAPGEHRALICVAETKDRGPETGGTSVSSKVVVCATISVFSPYPGKYIDFTLDVKNVSKNENATFNLEIISQGTEVVNVRGVFEIYYQDIKAGKETKIVTLNTTEKTLATGEKTILNATLNVSDFDIGEYKVKAAVYYDGEQLIKEKLFRIGDLYMEILDFTKEVTQNKLNPINIKVESKWNGEINNVYATLEIKDMKKNYVVATINSPPLNFLPWETKNLMAYWDTTGITAGEYNAKIILHYEDKKTVKEDKINVKVAERKISFTTMLLLILIVVIIVLILLIVRLIKKTQRNQNISVRAIKIKRTKNKKQKS